jgi:hypothetical protein
VLAKEILLKKLTVRESEALARRVAQDRVSSRHKIDPEILALEKSLTEKLGTRVTIEPREVGGRLVISFFNTEDLAALLEAMRIDREFSQSKVFDGVATAPKSDLMVQPDAGVVPDPAYPTPEEQNEKPAATLAGAFAVLAGTPVLETVLAQEKPQPEEDTNLYAIRDFSI